MKKYSIQLSSFDTLIKDVLRSFSNTCPQVKDVLENKPVTIIRFTDGTKSVVKLAESDTYDLEKAILYGIVKRAYATSFTSSNEAVCEGLGNLMRKLEANVIVAPKKEDKPYKKPVKINILPKGEPKANAPKSCFEFKTSPTRKTSKISEVLKKFNADIQYGMNSVKPLSQKKRFKDMNQEEKRAYWRAQKRKQRNK